VGFCELRFDYRTFKVDRIIEIRMLESTFNTIIKPFKNYDTRLTGKLVVYNGTTKIIYDAPAKYKRKYKSKYKYKYEPKNELRANDTYQNTTYGIKGKETY